MNTSIRLKHRSIFAGAGIFLAAIGFRPAVPAAFAAEKAARTIDYDRDIHPASPKIATPVTTPPTASAR
jgi:hypothetical protein